MSGSGPGPGEVTAEMLLELRRAAEADREDARTIRLDAIRQASALLVKAGAESSAGMPDRERQAIRQRLSGVDRQLAEIEVLLRARIGPSTQG